MTEADSTATNFGHDNEPIRAYTPKYKRLFYISQVLQTLIYGDYFDHLLPWYEHRGAANVHLVTYKRLKADTREEVLKVADFLGEQHGSSLRKDEALLQRVLNACSFDNMKVLFKEKPSDRAKMHLDTAPEKSEALAVANDIVQKKTEMHEGSGSVRKGIV